MPSCIVPASGSNLRVLMDFEDCFGVTPSSTAAVIIPCTTLDVNLSQPPQQRATLRAGRHSSKPFYGNKSITGTMTGPVGEQSIGYILKAYLGSPDSTATDEWIFSVDSTTPSFVVAKEFTDLGEYYVYNGCKATTLSFTFNTDNELIYNLGFIAASETPQDVTYDSNPEDLSDELFYDNPEIGTNIEEGGVADEIIEELTVNLNNGPTLAYTLSGAGEATYAADGKLEVSGTIRGIFINTDILDKGIAHIESSLDLTLTKSSNYLRAFIPELEWSQESPSVTGPGIVELNLTFIGFYQNSTEASDIVFYLYNSHGAY